MYITFFFIYLMLFVVFGGRSCDVQQWIGGAIGYAHLIGIFDIAGRPEQAGS